MPDQLPFVVLKVCPSSGVPEIDGAPVFDGASASTASLAAEVAESLPPPLVAVMTTRMVEPTSAPTSSYVEPVAAGMSTQLAPAASQRRH